MRGSWISIGPEYVRIDIHWGKIGMTGQSHGLDITIPGGTWETVLDRIALDQRHVALMYLLTYMTNLLSGRPALD
jgi:hypothetical protein